MVDFSQYMNKPLGEMRRILLPVGHYYGRFKNCEPKESGNGKPMLNTSFTLDSAGSDVDPTSLPEAGVAGKTVSVNYMLDTDFGQDDIRKMIEASGIQVDPAQSWGQYIAQLQNMPVLLYIDHRPREKDNPNSEMTEDIKKVLSSNTPVPEAA